jgi:multimeric flavodoxin WrbA
MKIVVINGSPRLKWNTVQLLDSFIAGMKSTGEELQIQNINVYDYNFKGCKSCFACQLKKFEGQTPECRVEDEIHDLLVDVRNADGIVVGSPIYFCDLSAQVKTFLERLMYPGPVAKPIPSAFIYTSNAPEDAFEQYINESVAITERYMKDNFKVFPDRICAYDTYQMDHEELYKKSYDMEPKRLRRETQFPIDLNNAYDGGIKFISKVKEIEV